MSNKLKQIEELRLSMINDLTSLGNYDFPHNTNIDFRGELLFLRGIDCDKIWFSGDYDFLIQDLTIDELTRIYSFVGNLKFLQMSFVNKIAEQDNQVDLGAIYRGSDFAFSKEVQDYYREKFSK